MHREFPADDTGLVNLALASDGKLIYLLIDRVECKDLFEPGDRLAYSVQVRRSDGNGAFIGAIQPDQLLLSNGRIIAVSDEGRFMRVYSLDDGRMLHSPGAAVAEGIDNTVAGLKTKAADWQVTLAAAGSFVYAFGPHSLVGFNLDHLGDTPYDPLEKDDEAQNLVIGKDYLLLLAKNAPSDRPMMHTQFPTAMAACSYSRAVTRDGRESGLFAARDAFSSPAGIQSWQAVDGGIYYLTGDQKLFFMKGARELTLALRLPYSAGVSIISRVPNGSVTNEVSMAVTAPNSPTMREKVQGVINLIRPAVQADGGDIELVDVTSDGVVQIRFHGACHGCPSCTMTLQMGIERNLREKVPEITSVVPVA